MPEADDAAEVLAVGAAKEKAGVLDDPKAETAGAVEVLGLPKLNPPLNADAAAAGVAPLAGAPQENSGAALAGSAGVAAGLPKEKPDDGAAVVLEGVLLLPPPNEKPTDELKAFGLVCAAPGAVPKVKAEEPFGELADGVGGVALLGVLGTAGGG